MCCVTSQTHKERTRGRYFIDLAICGCFPFLARRRCKHPPKRNNGSEEDGHTQSLEWDSVERKTKEDSESVATTHWYTVLHSPFQAKRESIH